MISVCCAACGQELEELEELGAILLSPPDLCGWVRKEHLCVECTSLVHDFIEREQAHTNR